MLKLDLARLAREGALRVQARVPAEDPLWDESDLAFASPLEVDLRAQEVTSGEVVVRGRVRGVLGQECRRCLDPVRTEIDEEITLVYAPRDLMAQEEEDEEVRLLPPGAQELDLGDAIREELILSLDPYAVCDPECRGLCPRCGVNLNQETCECVSEERDPRWDVLRSIKSE